MRRIFAISCALALALGLIACSDSGSRSQNGGSASQTPTGPAGSGAVSSSQTTSDGSGSQPGDLQTATLYIGMDGQFQEYLTAVEEDITPQLLVEEISKLTGWNLDLAGEITSGKGGMTVSFAETSSLFAGPPDPQKEEFHVFAADELDWKILDSVKKTLQSWAVAPGLGDPDSVDIYFCGPDGGDLVLDNVGVTISATKPYRTFFPLQG